MRTKHLRSIFYVGILVMFSTIFQMGTLQPVQAGMANSTIPPLIQQGADTQGSDPYLLFRDDFNDGNADGWTTTMSGTWTVVNGEYIVDMGQGQSLVGYSWAGDPNWADYVLQLDVYADQGADKSILFRNIDENGYWINLVGNPGNHLMLGLNDDYTMVYYPNYEGIWYHITISALGPHIRVYVNNGLLIDQISEILPGGIGLMGWTGAFGVDRIRFDNVEVRAIKPLYLPLITNP